MTEAHGRWSALARLYRPKYYKVSIYEERYQRFLETDGDCPECGHDHLEIRWLPASKVAQERWKYNCRSCRAIWYGPEKIKYN